MRTIWKYAIQPETTVEIPEGGQVLTVQVQREEPQMWVLVNPDAPKVTRTFLLYGAGHAIHEDNLTYIATFQLHNGVLVLHVFEQEREKE